MVSKRVPSEWDVILSDFLETGTPPIILMLGKRNGGKSALGYYLLETFGDGGYRMAAMGIPLRSLDILPDNIIPVWNSNISSIPPRTAVIFDESYVQYGSRDSMASPSKEMSRTIGVSRQNDQPLIWIAHLARMIDLNIRSYVDIFAFKQQGLLQAHFERDPMMKDMSNAATETLDAKIKEITATRSMSFNEIKSYTYIVSDSIEGLVTNPLPSFWSDNMSRMFSSSVCPVPRFTIFHKIDNPYSFFYALKETKSNCTFRNVYDCIVERYDQTFSIDIAKTLWNYLVAYELIVDQGKVAYITEKNLAILKKGIEKGSTKNIVGKTN